MSGSTRERLIEAGFELFSRQGFHAVGLDQVIAEAAVSKQTFYNHFESRDDLILAVIQRRDQFELETFREMLEECAGHDPRSQLEKFFEVLDAWLNRPDFHGCIFLSAAAEFPSPHDPIHQAAANHVRAAQAALCRLATVAGADDPEGLAEELAVLIEGAVLLRHATGCLEAAQVAGRIASELFARRLPPREQLGRLLPLQSGMVPTGAKTPLAAFSQANPTARGA
jgi:AcrR family transcriptional regulator